MDNHFPLDLSPVSKELHLILQLLKKDCPASQIITPESLNDVDWELFIDLAKHHRLYPLLYAKMRLLDQSLFPLFVVHRLMQDYQNNVFKMLWLSAEMEKVNKLFKEKGIRTIFLKGPVLAHQLYGDLSLRTSGDLDLLIPISDLERTEEILIELGYEKENYIKTVLNDWKWRHHHLTFIHPDKRLKLEVHWRLHPGPGREPPFNELWKRKQQSTLSNHPVYLLGNEDLFYFLTTHGARHGWSRLRWLIDIELLMEQGINWKELMRMMKKNHSFHVGGQAVILVSCLLGKNQAKNLHPFLIDKQAQNTARLAVFYLKEKINLHTNPLPPEISDYHKRYLFSLMSVQQKITLIASFLYPYPDDKETLPLPEKLHFLYFILRPLLWIWRKAQIRVHP